MSRIPATNAFPASITSMVLGATPTEADVDGDKIVIKSAHVVLSPVASLAKISNYYRLEGCSDAMVRIIITGPFKKLFEGVGPEVVKRQLAVKLWQVYSGDATGIVGTKFDWEGEVIGVKFGEETEILIPIGKYWNKFVRLVKENAEVVFTVHVGDAVIKSEGVHVAPPALTSKFEASNAPSSNAITEYATIMSKYNKEDEKESVASASLTGSRLFLTSSWL